jgi:acetyltransferase-like isoleucine patch superfamily enzyme
MMNWLPIRKIFAALIGLPVNRFHPLVWVLGNPKIGKGVYIGGMSEVNANGASLHIGDNCDIASFVTINCADSHLKCIGVSSDIRRKDIFIDSNVFIGSHCVIKGGTVIGKCSVVAAGTIVGDVIVPPYSLVIGNPAVIKPGYYAEKYDIDSNST